MVSINRNGIALSAGACLNGWPMPVHVAPTPILFPGRGDFAEREGGRIRRKDRRNAIARKHAFLES
jgi:hypothetical protein